MMVLVCVEEADFKSMTDLGCSDTLEYLDVTNDLLNGFPSALIPDRYFSPPPRPVHADFV